MNIDIRWTDAARADVDRHGLEFADVINVIDDARSVQVQVGDGPHRILFLGSGQRGEVLVVACDRQVRALAVYDLTEVRPANLGETRAWKKRQS